MPVIPVRMTEAWLLADQQLHSAGRWPDGSTDDLEIPELHRLESIPGSKGCAAKAMAIASGTSGRHRRSSQAVQFASPAARGAASTEQVLSVSSRVGRRLSLISKVS